MDKRGKFLAVATNSLRLNKYGGGTHAELAVLRKAGPKTRTIIVCRIGRNGILRPIEVCPACQRILNKKGILYYTIKGVPIK